MARMHWPLRPLFLSSTLLFVALAGFGADGGGVVGGASGGSGLLQVGEPCTTAAECEQDLICPFVARGSDERACEDPLDGIYDDGTRPELEGVGGVWARKRVGGWQENGLVCNDGSPYAYYISPGQGEGADDWLIFFKGGVDCSDDESCARRWVDVAVFMRQALTAQPAFSPGDNLGTDSGVFARDQQTNHFRNWNFVYMHYCTSDHHLGTRHSEDATFRFHFRGRANSEAVIDELINGVDLSPLGGTMMSLASAKNVVVAGASAGSTATRQLMDWIATRVRQVNPSASIKGWSDSVWTPRAFSWQYNTNNVRHELYGKSVDADCQQAHPDSYSYLCNDAFHMLHGGSLGEYFGEADSGHLGVALPGESAVDGLFIFQAQYDSTSLSSYGLFGWCVRSGECSNDVDCGVGRGCLQGICYDVEPCTPTYCTPEDEPCYGPDDPPTCLGEVVTHQNVCTQDAECLAGEECLFGYCVQEGFTGCESSDECPAGFTCSGRRCSAGVTAIECWAYDGYQWDADSLRCMQRIGCSDSNPCGSGYACLDGPSNPVGQVLSWGAREELGNLGDSVGVYVANSTTHTATLGPNYYGGAAVPRIDGHSHAQVVGAWMSGSPAYYDHIAPPSAVPTLLWASDIFGLSAGSISSRTTTTDCNNDAILFVLCDVESACDSAGSALYAVGIGDEGTAPVAGSALALPVQLQLRILKNPACTTPASITLSPGAFLDLSYEVPTTAAGHIVRIALPAMALTPETLPQTLFIGADGATYADRELTNMVADRLPAQLAPVRNRYRPGGTRVRPQS